MRRSSATADCRKTYEELKARGLEFVQPPTERPYGIEALVKDDSGNWFSMTHADGLTSGRSCDEPAGT